MPIAINGSGTLTGLSTGGISDTKAVADASMPAGAILQVVEIRKTDTFSVTDGNFNTITGLSGSITPSSSSNKILVLGSINVSLDDSGGGDAAVLLISRTVSGSEDENIFVGDANANNKRGFAHLYTHGNNYGQYSTNTHFLDVPNTTSAITYAVKIRCVSSTPIGINYPIENNVSGSGPARTASSLLLLEVAV